MKDLYLLDDYTFINLDTVHSLFINEYDGEWWVKCIDKNGDFLINDKFNSEKEASDRFHEISQYLNYREARNDMIKVSAMLLSGVLSSDYKQPRDLKEIVRMADSLINEVEMYI